MRKISRDDLIGAFPVFLLEIQWGGRNFRFSTYPINILKNDGSSLQFAGGLEDPSLEESLSTLDKSPEKNTLPVEIVFDVDLIEEFFRFGRTLDGATAELSMVTERNKTIIQTYENRIKIFSGDIIQPLIGDPNQPPGYAAFTIERNPNNKASPIISPDGIFQGDTSIITSVTLDNFSTGMAYPIVFGEPKEFLQPGSIGVLTLGQSYPTPGFIIFRQYTSTGVPNQSDYAKFWLCIADRPVAASTVTIRDYQNNIKSGVPVKTTITQQGKEISYVELQYAYYSSGVPIIVDGIVNPWMLAAPTHGTAQTDSPEYFVSWDNGGGMLNPFGDGFLDGAGDIILFFLDMSNVDIDRNAWNNVASFLNGYRFGGFINDPQITPYKFLQDNIFPFVPVLSVNGANGIRPVIPLIYQSQIPRIVYDVEIGVGFYFISAINWSSEPDDIINRLLLRWGYCLFRKTNPGSLVIAGNLKDNEHTEVKTNTETAMLSYTQYGDRYEEEDADFIYDWKTAIKSAQYIIRTRALPKMEIEIQADSVYGWLQLGDVLALTSAGYFMDRFKVQIIEKSWKNGSWLFTVELENNVMINER